MLCPKKASKFTPDPLWEEKIPFYNFFILLCYLYTATESIDFAIYVERYNYMMKYL